MKNIIICGTCRAGKSLLSKEIKRICPWFNLYHIDQLRDALTHTFNKDFNSEENHNELRHFIYNLYKECLIEQKNNPNNFNKYVIIEGIFITKEEILTNYNDGNSIIIFVGKPKLTDDEYFNDIRSKEKIYNTWTVNQSDEKVREMSKNFVLKSCEDEQFCKQHGFLFLDTSYNQDKSITQFAKKIKNLVKK